MVGIVLGSKSDVALANEAAQVLEALKVGYEVRVLSAHRTPLEVAQFATEAAGRGFKVLIGIAGLSAALPGVLAAQTSLPVIGVPVAVGTLGGLEALLSTSQMPAGVPVAAVGIGSSGACNAALLACRILALSDPMLSERLSNYMGDMRGSILEADSEFRRTWQPSEG